MEAIISHSPTNRNGPIYRTYGNSPFPVAVYRTCCAKCSKAKSTVTHADPTHVGTRGFFLPVWQPAMSTYAFPSAHKKKGLLFVPSRIFKTYGCGLTVQLATRNSSSKSISWEAA